MFILVIVFVTAAFFIKDVIVSRLFVCFTIISALLIFKEYDIKANTDV